MHPDEFLEAIRREGAAFASAATDLDLNVPSCPEWNVRQLINHLGRVHRWVTAMVRTQSPERLDFPAKPDAVDVEWFEEGLSELTAALEEAGPDVHLWTFPGGGGTTRFWFRRQAEETAVHRWDAQLASGEPDPIEKELAIAGVDEMLDVILPMRAAAFDGTVHFHATDSPHGEWIVRAEEGGGLLVGHGHEKGDVALRATASDLLLWLWGRPVLPDRFEVFGKEGILDQWRETLSMG